MSKKLMLPSSIKVKITREKSGTWFAYLLDYDIHTEADDLVMLGLMINDLIYAYFDLPKRYWGKVVYTLKPGQHKSNNNNTRSLLIGDFLRYNKFVSPGAHSTLL